MIDLLSPFHSNKPVDFLTTDRGGGEDGGVDLHAESKMQKAMNMQRAALRSSCWKHMQWEDKLGQSKRQ